MVRKAIIRSILFFFLLSGCTIHKNWKECSLKVYDTLSVVNFAKQYTIKKLKIKEEKDFYFYFSKCDSAKLIPPKLNSYSCDTLFVFWATNLKSKKKSHIAISPKYKRIYILPAYPRSHNFKKPLCP